MRRSLLACLFAIVASLAAAEGERPEPSRLQALTDGDATRGWESVGRLNFGQSGFCTGALITPSIVLTAAHCLFDTDTGVRIDDARIAFLAGWRSGRAEAYRGVRRSVIHPDYQFGDDVELERVAVDLALVELDMPVRNGRITPFETGTSPLKGEAVGIVSYATDRSEIPSLQETCHVLERGGGVVMLSCDVDFGASGAPVFRFVDGKAEIVSVVSAKATADGQRVALASAFGSRFETLLQSFGDPAIVDAVDVEATAPTTRIGGAESSAKFVRP